VDFKAKTTECAGYFWIFTKQYPEIKSKYHVLYGIIQNGYFL